MLPSEGQLTLLQNEIGFLHVVFRWANSLATKWLSIFKGLSTTETLKMHKMQFPSSWYKMPGPTPFFHLILSLARPWNGAQGLPFCSGNSNGDIYGMIILLVLAKLHKAIGSSPSPCGSAFSWSCGHSQIRRCTCAVCLLVPPTQWLRQSGQLSQMPATSTTIPQCPTEWDAEAGIFFKWRFSKIGDTPKPWVSNLILK